MALVSISSYHSSPFRIRVRVKNFSRDVNAYREQLCAIKYLLLRRSVKIYAKKSYMQEALLFCFKLKKPASKSHRLFVEAYGYITLSENVQRLVSVMESWKFWLERHAALNSSQKCWGFWFVGSFRWSWYPIAHEICWPVRRYISSYLHASVRHGKDAEGWKLRTS